MKKVMLVLAFMLVLASCDNGTIFNGLTTRTSTIDIRNISGSSVSAKIYYGDKHEKITLNEFSTNFSFESTGKTPCLILYDGRYVEFGSTGTFTVPHGETYMVSLNSNIGWIQLINYTSSVISFPKYGDSFFMWNADGDLLSVDDASDLLYREEQYCKVETSGIGYINFRLGMKNLRLSSITNGSVGFTQLIILTGATPVVEI
jgi:hypothetical protein